MSNYIINIEAWEFTQNMTEKFPKISQKIHSMIDNIYRDEENSIWKNTEESCYNLFRWAEWKIKCKPENR
jgi:hypothetical protein